jgi:hypothetical protein
MASSIAFGRRQREGAPASWREPTGNAVRGAQRFARRRPVPAGHEGKQKYALPSSFNV